MNDDSGRGPGRPGPSGPSGPRAALAGAGLAWRGLRVWSRSPRIMAIGVLPALATLALLAAALVAIVSEAGHVGDWAADRLVGDGDLHGVLGALVAIALVGGAALIAVTTFTTLALALGQPAYEAISRRVDDDAGGVDPAPEEPWWRALARGLGEGVVTLAVSLVVSALLFAIGLIPVAGTVTAAATGAIVGGRLLALELTAYPMARRGIVARRDRIAALRPHRVLVGGFGAAAFLAFLVPLGAVVAMPAAVAGATLLVRRVLGEDPA
ncbi:EI24 domain-containing protein [Demequina pelophila]|uniref:EI24 domain-containing protein n=1 Tax=Demequina pelophila TaxID=1638984 RepID=UPI000781F3EB|nr:EI24 domain-containing protein [Demequina pelophila]